MANDENRANLNHKSSRRHELTFGRCRAKSGQHLSISAPNWSRLRHIWRVLIRIRPNSPKCCPTSAGVGPDLVHSRPYLAEFGRCLPRVGQIRVECGSTSNKRIAVCRSNSPHKSCGRSRVKLGPTYDNVGVTSPNLMRHPTDCGQT